MKRIDVVLAVVASLFSLATSVLAHDKPKPQPQPDTVYVEKKSNSNFWLGAGVGLLAGTGIWWLVRSHDECQKKEDPSQPTSASTPVVAPIAPIVPSPPMTPVTPAKPRAAVSPKPKPKLDCEMPAQPKPVTRMGLGVDQAGVVGLKVKHDF